MPLVIPFVCSPDRHPTRLIHNELTGKLIVIDLQCTRIDPGGGVLKRWRGPTPLQTGYHLRVYTKGMPVICGCRTTSAHYPLYLMSTATHAVTRYSNSTV